MPEPTQTVTIPTTPTPAATVSTNIAAPVVTTPVIPEPDLMTKVTQFKRPETSPVAEGVDIGFDYKEIEAIKDPVAKDIAIKAYRSMQSGVTKKFQEASVMKKEAEEARRQVEIKLEQAKYWSQERVQTELLNNPQFLAIAQAMSAPNNAPNDSLLSEEERTKINGLEAEINRLKQTNFQSMISQQDNVLRTKYADYNPVQIDETIARLSKMQPQEIREWVYKAIMHDPHVKSGYELAKQELSQLNQERVSAFSPSGGQAVITSDAPSKEKGESDSNFFSRLYQNNKARLLK